MDLFEVFSLAPSKGNILTPEEIVHRAIEQYKPVAIYVGFSGGNDSRAVAHWMMNNVPGCEPFHANTGIGIERTRQSVRDTCKAYGWNLHEIRALEDCGQSYDDLCAEFGFPGPDGHQMMYSRLKERCVRELVRRAKKGHPRTAKVLIASGIRHDESLIRMGYAGREINTVGGQVWVNPLYWWTKQQRDAYNAASGMPENPVTKELGMSGECGCGAFAHPGELARWRAVDPSFGERIDKLQQRVLQCGFTWGWEGRPPAGGNNPNQTDLFRPMCVGCEKSAIVQAEMNDERATAGAEGVDRGWGMSEKKATDSSRLRVIADWLEQDGTKAAAAFLRRLAGDLERASPAGGEPVAWHIGNADGSISSIGAVYIRRSLAEKHIASYEGELDATIVPLYAAQPAQPKRRPLEAFATVAEWAAQNTTPVSAPAAAVPPGFKLVPDEPTDAMTFIGQKYRYDPTWSIGAIYNQMLAAAPQPGEGDPKIEDSCVVCGTRGCPHCTPGY